MSAPLSPSGDPSATGREASWPLIALTATMLVARLIAAGHVHLTEDEAYYRLWSMAPALGYYDHPPMIAWWIWLGRHIAGDSALGVRLLPILASAATCFLVFDLARLVGADRTTAVRAGIWFNAMLLVAAGGFLAVPDAPASLFWTATLACVLRAARGGSWRWWAAAGLTAGLAALSKYSALFLAPGVLLCLAVTPSGRGRLRSPGPWLACLIAVGVFSLNVLWNANHQWLTFHKQFGRIAVHSFEPRYLIELIAGQAVLLNPVIAIFLAAAVVKPAGADERSVKLSPLIAVSAPFALYLLIHSLHDRVQAHWPAPIYPALAVIAAVTAERLIERPVWRRLAFAAPIFGLTMGAIALIYILIPARYLGGASDVAAPVRGWSTFATDLDRLRGPSGAAWIGAASYGVAAELADEPQLKAPITQLTERDRWTTLEPGGAPDFSKPGLVVDLPRRVTYSSLSRCFAEVEPLGYLSRGAPQGRQTAYAVFRVASSKRDIPRMGC